MMPGPNYVYKCPNCGNLLTKGSLSSGNTFGAKIYSDGKMKAPMLPEFPDLTKCRKCNSIFWLSKLRKVGTYKWGDNIKSKWENADDANFLKIKDYFEAIEKGLAENKEEEFFIRQRIWWSYNKRTRKGKNIFKGEEDELRWKENLNQLLSLLDLSEVNQRIMAAEIHRNLGAFENCISLIESIDDGDHNLLKEKFLAECERKNRLTIVLIDGSKPPPGK
jgi:hypothetical protein